jgi:hypothetical protein
MSNKNLTILGVVTILMVIWAVVQSRVSSIPRSGPEALPYNIRRCYDIDGDMGGGSVTCFEHSEVGAGGAILSYPRT